MTPEAEKFNGWAAMLGFVAAFGAYATTGQIIPGIFWMEINPFKPYQQFFQNLLKEPTKVFNGLVKNFCLYFQEEGSIENSF